MNRETSKRLHEALSAGREIQQYVATTTRAQFMEDRSLELIFERLFEIVGEAMSQAEDADSSLRQRIPELGDIVGMRNRIAHGYDVVDNELIWSTAVDEIPDLCRTLEDLLVADPVD